MNFGREAIASVNEVPVDDVKCEKCICYEHDTLCWCKFWDQPTGINNFCQLYRRKEANVDEPDT